MRTIAIAGILLAVPHLAAAQEGGIAGAVTDDTGGVLPGVTVEASSDALPGPRVAFTDGDGLYRFAALPPGSYVVTYTLPGFERAEREVDVAADVTATVDVDLPLGGLFEEVTVSVTGTAIEAPAINMPHAVTVVSRETLEQQGATQLVDLFRNLNVSHGVVGERNSWYNSNQPSTLTENVANVNLRGLGASRTLVLINGRRHVPVPARLIGGRFVDVNTIPAIAVGRLEVLKEGASATYGSDAVGGVANFVTRSDFRGFEINVSHDYFDSGGDTTVAGIWGGPDRGFDRRLLGRACRAPGVADGGAPLDAGPAEHARPGQPRRLVEPREPRHIRGRGARAVDRRRLRSQLHGLRRAGRRLDVPVPLRPVRQPDRRAAADARLRRDQRPAEQPDELPHRGSLGRRRDTELVHDAVVSTLPADEHDHHGGDGGPSGAAGVLRRLRRRRQGRSDGGLPGRRPLVLQRPPVRKLGPRAPAAPGITHPARRGVGRRRLPDGRARRQLGTSASATRGRGAI